jgi:hypothetical protein
LIQVYVFYKKNKDNRNINNKTLDWVIASDDLGEMKKTMKNQNQCPCCSNPLLRHVSFNRTYWFCSHCYQEMPDIENILESKSDSWHWITKRIPDRNQSKERVSSTKQLHPSLETKIRVAAPSCLR